MGKTAKFFVTFALAAIFASGAFFSAKTTIGRSVAGGVEAVSVFAAPQQTAGAGDKTAGKQGKQASAKRPYDVSITLTCGKKTWRYNLLDAAKNLSQAQINERKIYESPAAKRALAKSLVKEGVSAEAALGYVLPDFSATLVKICRFIEYDAYDAEITFVGRGFEYSEDKCGLKVDKNKLAAQIISALGKKDAPKSFEVPLIKTKAAFTLADAKKATSLRGEFSTTFFSSGENRCHNIALALAKLNGLAVESGDDFSFNLAVGPRGEADGYRQGKVIVDGEYVDGIGGGVCQASTTLYNALLVSNLPVTGAQRHSLVSSYIEPSFDAAVSYNGADLRFENNTKSRVYICAYVENKTAHVKIFGLPNKYTIKRVSTVVERVPFETKTVIDSDKKYADRVKYTDETAVVQGGSDKVVSKGYLHYYSGEKLVKKVQVRTDTYASAPRVVVKGAEARPVLPEQAVQDFGQT